MYSTEWCHDCFRTREWLRQHNFLVGRDYIEVNIDEVPEAVAIVEKANHGMRSVPTLIFADGTVLTEPSPVELSSILKK